MLIPEWRPDGSLVIQCQAEIVEFGQSAGLFRFLLTPEAVAELKEVLARQPAVKVAGKHESGPGV